MVKMLIEYLLVGMRQKSQAVAIYRYKAENKESHFLKCLSRLFFGMNGPEESRQ